MGATHYQVLGVPEDASHSVIRASYLSSVLALHPDKLSVSHDSPLSANFLRLQEAWTVLRDSGSRSAYDRHLSCSRFSTDVVAEDVSLEEMTIDPCEVGDNFEYYFPCRCGDFFAVSTEELETLGLNESCTGSGRQCGEPESWGECKSDDSEVEISATSKVVDEIFHHRLLEVEGVPKGYSEDSGRNSHAKHPSPLELKSLLLPCGSCSSKIRLWF